MATLNQAPDLPPRDHDSLSDSSNDSTSSWQDIDQEEEEQVAIVSLLDDKTFPSSTAMLQHIRDTYNFDYLAVRKQLKLDFLGAIKLINLVRASVRDNIKLLPESITREQLDDDVYLKPVLKDDALILCLGDLIGDAEEKEDAEVEKDEAEQDGSKQVTVEELGAKNKELQEQLRILTRQFEDYKIAVAETLDQRWESTGPTASASREVPKDESAYYWNSYAGNSIHEIMLKDTVRTDAYRDFIYLNKDLFAGKVVLDVGCGTGILSMFCAKAGAARVIAVDKSEIIHKARQNIYENGLAHTITCLHGAIEELILPVDQVDIIVSEWMGYALLYEAMLPSVFYARDKWLAPGGLLVPSTATLWLAPLADGEYVAENFAFWRDVYGFDMKAMQRGIYDETRVAVIPPASLCGEAKQFLRLDLQNMRKEDLSFTAKWALNITKSVDVLDGFLVWFDIFFTRTPENDMITDGTTAQEWTKKGQSNVAFTTGPHDRATHWAQTLLIAKPEENKPVELGTNVTGEITYAVLEGDKSARALSIETTWSVVGRNKRTQRWKLQ